MPEINWLGAVAAGVVGFVFGGLWYSPLLFQKIWLRETGIDPKGPMRYPVWLPMVGAVALSILGAIGLSLLMGHSPSLKDAVLTGAVVGFLCVAPAIKMNGLFGQNSPVLIMIHTLYPALQCVLMAVILSLLG